MKRVLALMLAALAAFLLVAPQGALAQTTTETTARLRVVHAATGAPGVDVYLDGQVALESRDFFSEGELELTPGVHEVAVVAEGESAASPLVGKQVDVLAGESYTLALIGSGENVTGLLLKDRSSTLEPDEARVRIIHAADQLGAVDVALAGGEPFLEEAVFGSVNYIDVGPGTYALDLSAAANGEALLQTVDLEFNAGWSYTLIVTGESQESLWVQAIVDREGR
jgi:uncharacterized protein (DUF2141 family)